MNDEIKEILDRLDFEEWEVDLYKVPITWCELYDIRDYITNLQQEIERQSKAQVILDDMLADYKSRIEKAVELIHDKLDRFDCDGSMAVSMSISYFEEDLLNILQNGSDEE